MDTYYIVAFQITTAIVTQGAIKKRERVEFSSVRVLLVAAMTPSFSPGEPYHQADLILPRVGADFHIKSRW